MLVKKKDNSLRMCVDYRDSNRAIHIQDVNLPRLDTTLESMAESVQDDILTEALLGHPGNNTRSEPKRGEPEPLSAVSSNQEEVSPTSKANLPDLIKTYPNTGRRTLDCDEEISAIKNWPGQGYGPRFWSVCDMASGFLGLPIKEGISQELTAFVTPDAKYQWQRLPFGLACGPSYQTQLMNSIFAGIQYKVLICYMDDICLWSYTAPQMLERMEMMLERVVGAGLTLRADKFTFFSLEIDFLGHRLSREGIGVSPGKTEAISRIDPLSINNVTAVRSFLGATGFYRKFIRGYSEISRPLVDLTKKNVDVAELSKQENVQEAIRILKNALVTAPVLALPRWDRQWIVKTDGSLTGIGGVLAQANDDGDEKPVAYFARQLTPAERNYSVTEIELLAVIAALKTWRSYLWTYTEKAFILQVDHAALLYLSTCVDNAGGGGASRLTRWSLKLQEYNFIIKHRAGRIHHDADFLSRMSGNVEYKAFKASPEGAMFQKLATPSI